MFWVISVYFNIRNTLPKSGTFLLGHPVYDFGGEICADVGERIILKCLSDVLGARGLGLSVAGLERWLIILDAVINIQVLHIMRNFLKR